MLHAKFMAGKISTFHTGGDLRVQPYVLRMNLKETYSNQLKRI